MADKHKPKAKAKSAEAKEQAPKGRIRAVPPAEWPPVIGLTVDEAAAALRTDDKTIRRLIQTGSLPARLVGRAYRLDPSAIRAWVASGEDGRKASPSADEINAQLAESAEADLADPEVQDYLRSGRYAGSK